MRRMRVGSMILAAGVAAAALSVSAQPVGDATAPYAAELAQQCPQRQLQMLSAADLRNGLDNFVAGLAFDQQDRLQAAERAQCSSMDAGAACVNLADIT